MQSIDSALLFVGNPTLALEHFGESLNKRLRFLGIEFEKSSSEDNRYATFTAAGLELSVQVSAFALPAESFLGALDSPLSSPFRGILSNTLFRHTRHMVLSVIPKEPDRADAPTCTRLTMLRVAHAATTLLTEWHMPAAVHWRQSNQLLVGEQYLKLAADTTPWVLFAHARVIPGIMTDVNERRESLRLDEAIELIGRPILFTETSRPLEEIHAAALAFLRYTVENETPIPNGDSFGPEGGNAVKVTHVAPCADIPHGRYDLSAIETVKDGFVSKRLSAVEKRGSNVQVEAPNAYTPVDPEPKSNLIERNKSLAISYAMLLVMPPIGFALFISNALFGDNPWRTGLIATASVALALVVSAYTFLNYVGQETAVFIYPSPIEAIILTE